MKHPLALLSFSICLSLASGAEDPWTYYDGTPTIPASSSSSSSGTDDIVNVYLEHQYSPNEETNLIEAYFAGDMSEAIERYVSFHLDLNEDSEALYKKLRKRYDACIKIMEREDTALLNMSKTLKRTRSFSGPVISEETREFGSSLLDILTAPPERTVIIKEREELVKQPRKTAYGPARKKLKVAASRTGLEESYTQTERKTAKSSSKAKTTTTRPTTRSSVKTASRTKTTTPKSVTKTTTRESLSSMQSLRKSTENTSSSSSLSSSSGIATANTTASATHSVSSPIPKIANNTGGAGPVSSQNTRPVRAKPNSRSSTKSSTQASRPVTREALTNMPSLRRSVEAPATASNTASSDRRAVATPVATSAPITATSGNTTTMVAFVVDDSTTPSPPALPVSAVSTYSAQRAPSLPIQVYKPEKHFSRAQHASHNPARIVAFSLAQSDPIKVYKPEKDVAYVQHPSYNRARVAVFGLDPPDHLRLFKLFTRFGLIESMQFFDESDNLRLSYAFINYQNMDSAVDAVNNQQRTLFHDYPFGVDYSPTYFDRTERIIHVHVPHFERFRELVHYFTAERVSTTVHGLCFRAFASPRHLTFTLLFSYPDVARRAANLYSSLGYSVSFA